MYNKTFDNIIIGGTYTGLGILLSAKGENLLISHNVYIEDFSPAFRYGDAINTSNFAGQTSADGLINIAKAAIYFYGAANDKSVLYETFISNMTQNSVTLHNTDGEHTVKGQNVIITEKSGEIQQKFYNALIKCTTDAVGNHDGYSILRTCFGDIFQLRASVEENCTYDEARKIVQRILTNHSGLELVLTAAEFEVRQTENLGELLSCNAKNSYEAFERGRLYATAHN